MVHARGTIVLTATLLSTGCHEVFGVDTTPAAPTFATLVEDEIAIDGTDVFWTTERGPHV